MLWSKSYANDIFNIEVNSSDVTKFYAGVDIFWTIQTTVEIFQSFIFTVICLQKESCLK